MSLISQIMVGARVQNVCRCTSVFHEEQTTVTGVEVTECPTMQKAVLAVTLLVSVSEELSASFHCSYVINKYCSFRRFIYEDK